MSIILITGGNGFIGSHVAKKLYNNGEEVHIIDREISDSTLDFFGGKFCRDFSIRDERCLLKSIEAIKPEYVIHLAAQANLRKSIDDPFEDLLDNILGSFNLFQVCGIVGGVKRIIYTSTGGARYGEKRKGKAKETSKVNPISPYGISKHTAEHYLKYFCLKSNIDYVTLCLGNVFGPGEDPEKSQRIIPLLIDALLNDKKIVINGDGYQRRDFVYIDNVVQVIEHLLTVDQINQRFYNIASGRSYSINKIISMLEEISGKKLDVSYGNEIEGEVKEIGLDISAMNRDFPFVPQRDMYECLEEMFK